ncbi:type VI secretion system lipoprotein TssJ [Aquabacterium sp.]|uniref:type VI secretion system lipoprotein TssJ n=1 Tax=Aquabacterium sp. TaxID=1872578 RepID=UPI002B81CF1A|nr:type VI secretion system lipoprotein TssJ [Aquabacterium sp.]HSW04174.1 type VI secretion system lipoprotein TssJ [Aquabacterium sp.]
MTRCSSAATGACFATLAGTLLPVVVATLVSGCAATGGGPLDKAMELVGLKKPEVPDSLPKELPVLTRKVALRLHAGDRLNTDAQGRSLSIVARVYKLRASTAFLQLPYEAFSLSPSDRSSPLGQEVIDVREVTLTPGQRHEVIETLPIEATHLAVVALFRAPAEQRWRFAFDAKTAAASGITLGLHGCAMSVAEGQAVNTAPEVARLAGVRCGKE